MSRFILSMALLREGRVLLGHRQVEEVGRRLPVLRVALLDLFQERERLGELLLEHVAVGEVRQEVRVGAVDRRRPLVERSRLLELAGVVVEVSQIDRGPAGSSGPARSSSSGSAIRPKTPPSSRCRGPSPRAACPPPSAGWLPPRGVCAAPPPAAAWLGPPWKTHEPRRRPEASPNATPPRIPPNRWLSLMSMGPGRLPQSRPFGHPVVRLDRGEPLEWLAVRAKESLYGLDAAAIARRLEPLGAKPYAPRQVSTWLYRRGARDFSEMTDLGAALRAPDGGGVRHSPPLDRLARAIARRHGPLSHRSARRAGRSNRSRSPSGAG